MQGMLGVRGGSDVTRRGDRSAPRGPGRLVARVAAGALTVLALLLGGVTPGLADDASPAEHAAVAEPEAEAAAPGAVPGEAAPTPGEAAQTPDGAADVPDDAVTVPDDAAPVPGDAAPLPDDAAPLPDDATATPDGAVRDSYTIVIVFDFEGTLLGEQTLTGLQHGSLITADDLFLPDGFVLKHPFMDFTVFRDDTLVFDVVEIEEPARTYDITVRYTFEGTEIGREVLAGLPEQFVIHDEDLAIPAGYVQAGPMPPHIVVANATLDIAVLSDSVPVFDVTVWYVYGDQPEGLQIYWGLPVGAVITEETLVLPVGFVLEAPFADFVVTGGAELTIRVVPEATEPATKPPVTTVPPTPETPPTGPQAGPAHELADSGSAPLTAVAGLAALGVLVGGAVLLSRAGAGHRCARGGVRGGSRT